MSRIDRRMGSLLGALLSLCSWSQAAASAVDARPAEAKLIRPAQAVPGRYIVQLEEDEAANRVAGGRAERTTALAREITSTHDGEVLHVYTRTVNGFSARLSEDAVQALTRDSRVKRIEQDSLVRRAATQSGAMWNLDILDRTPILLYSGSYTYNRTGAGVHAYVIDDGININHPDFGGRASYAYSNIDHTGDGIVDHAPCFGHGTHVAGILGGTTYGVAKGVSLHSVRVLACENDATFASQIIDAVEWVTANHQSPAVVNMSIEAFSLTLEDAVEESISEGLTYVAAAGNGNPFGVGISACELIPARIPQVITVSAINLTRSRPTFANTGSCVDLFAPGVIVPSAWYTYDPTFCGSGNAGSTSNPTCVLDGTSMAAPHVAGMAAMYLEANPTATPATVSSAIVGGAHADGSNLGTNSPNAVLHTFSF